MKVKPDIMRKGFHFANISVCLGEPLFKTNTAYHELRFEKFIKNRIKELSFVLLIEVKPSSPIRSLFSTPIHIASKELLRNEINNEGALKP